MNKALSNYKQDDGIENCAISIIFMFLNLSIFQYNYR